MSIEARIVEALQEGPLSRTDLRVEIGGKEGTFKSAVRRLMAAGDILQIDPPQKGLGYTYRALRTETTIINHAKGVQLARIWDPMRDPKPDWLKRESSDA